MPFTSLEALTLNGTTSTPSSALSNSLSSSVVARRPSRNVGLLTRTPTKLSSKLILAVDHNPGNTTYQPIAPRKLPSIFHWTPQSIGAALEQRVSLKLLGESCCQRPVSLNF